MAKSCKGIAVEMANNKIASLFLVKMLNSLDDTVLAQKLIVNEFIK